MTATVAKPATVRGIATRDALLDAAESLIADEGFRAPSHRAITGAAGVHVALLNYHFGNKEMLFEAAVERRARRLTQEWRDAVERVRQRASWTVEEVLRAWWYPFGQMRPLEDPPWRNYLCVIARLTSAPDGDGWHERYFGPIDREFLRTLAEALPNIAQDDLEAGFRYASSLLGEVLLHICGKTGGSCIPRGFREDDIERLIGFLAHGMRSLSRNAATAI